MISCPSKFVCAFLLNLLCDGMDSGQWLVGGLSMSAFCVFAIRDINCWVSESKRVSIMWGKLRIFLEISVHCLGQWLRIQVMGFEHALLLTLDNCEQQLRFYICGMKEILLEICWHIISINIFPLVYMLNEFPVGCVLFLSMIFKFLFHF